jgi:hypothetical protein
VEKSKKSSGSSSNLSMRRQGSANAVGVNVGVENEISPKTVAADTASTPRSQALENGVRYYFFFFFIFIYKTALSF